MQKEIKLAIPIAFEIGWTIFLQRYSLDSARGINVMINETIGIAIKKPLLPASCIRRTPTLIIAGIITTENM